MRLSNRAKAPRYHFVGTLLLVVFFAGISIFVIDQLKMDFLGWKSYLLLIVPILLLLLFYYRGRQIFEYDSDGEALNFRNRNVFPILNKPLNDEFPKYKFVKYELIDLFIFRRLYITITSKKNTATVLKYDISYLTSKQARDLKRSLCKVVSANNQQCQANIISA